MARSTFVAIGTQIASTKQSNPLCCHQMVIRSRAGAGSDPASACASRDPPHRPLSRSFKVAWL